MVAITLGTLIASGGLRSEVYDTFFIVAACSLSILTIALLIMRSYTFKYRRDIIAQMAHDNGWDQQALTARHRENIVGFQASAITRLGREKINAEENCLYAPDWSYCDYSYPISNRGRYGKEEVARVYYAAMGTRLPRKLPHVVFDSLQSRKRQMRFLFDENQRHKLEGDFDQHFASYFPEDYSIDALSFISPDVMQALKEADEYDIEIIDDRLFMFGSMYQPEEQIPDMAAKLMAIKGELLDNILTYRDQRVFGAEGQKQVSIEGARLQKSIWPTVFAIIGTFIAFFAVWLLYWQSVASKQ